jgi:hypothetical protein
MQVRQVGWTVHVLGYRSGTVELTIVGIIAAHDVRAGSKAQLTASAPGAQSGHSTKTVRSDNCQIQKNADPTLSFLELRRCQLEFARLLPVTVVRGPFPISFQLLLEDLGSGALTSFCKVVER